MSYRKRHPVICITLSAVNGDRARFTLLPLRDFGGSGEQNLGEQRIVAQGWRELDVGRGMRQAKRGFGRQHRGQALDRRVGRRISAAVGDKQHGAVAGGVDGLGAAARQGRQDRVSTQGRGLGEGDAGVRRAQRIERTGQRQLCKVARRQEVRQHALSVGIESIADIIADLEQALGKV